MSEYGYKRKRGLQDSPAGLSKMSMALNRLEAIKKELDGVEKLEDELYYNVSDNVLALENILKSDKKEVHMVPCIGAIVNNVAESNDFFDRYRSRPRGGWCHEETPDF